MHRRRRRLWKGIVSGLAGGLAATFAMSQFQSASKRWTESHHNGSPTPLPPEEEPATTTAAQSISRAAAGRELAPEEKKIRGPAVRYALGAANGMLYGALSEYQPKNRAGRGTALGAGLWALADQIGVAALKVSKPPHREPPSEHLYGLASHLIYGLTTDAVSRGVRALL